MINIAEYRTEVKMRNLEIGMEAFKKVIIQLFIEFNVIVDSWILRFEESSVSWVFSVKVNKFSVTLIIPLIDLDIEKAAEGVVLALEELDGA